MKEQSRASERALDCTGRPIQVGDVLKIYHFQGARRKRFFMFKQVVGVRAFKEGGHEYLIVSHLNMKPADGPDSGYFLRQDGETHADTEIVQGLDWHHDRPRFTARGMEARQGGNAAGGAVHDSPVPTERAP